MPKKNTLKTQHQIKECQKEDRGQDILHIGLIKKILIKILSLASRKFCQLPNISRSFQVSSILQTGNYL